MTKKIFLHGGAVALVDDEDYERLSAVKWYSHTQGYAIRTDIIGGKRIYLRMHRVIVGANKGDIVDHINGDVLDNRKENLRLVTAQQNALNTKVLSAANTSGYRGVTFNKQKQKWKAQLRNNGKSVFLGYFDTAKDGAKAYNEAAKQYHGEFAVLNIIEEETK